MKPLPAQDPGIVEVTDSAIQSLASALASAAASHSTSNRRAANCRVAPIYPWLLVASTAVAAVFCLMYITKPFIVSPQGAGPGNPPPPVPAKTLAAIATPASLMPSHDRLPGEKSTRETPRDTGIAARTASSTSSASSAPVAFEQTNLRIQHILTAEAPGGHLARINLDVPVLYQSRNLRWTAAEVAEARELLGRLETYQEKSRLLRSEGAELLDSWNRLIERSIPAGDLRADSPTLPANQQDAADSPRPAGLDTRELIQIQPAGK